MKKLQIATNGHPRTNNDLIHLQDAILEIGSALGRLCSDDAGTTTPVIIGGLKFTSLGGGLFTIGDGWVFYNNEIFYFAGNPPNVDPPDYLRISSTYAANNPYLGKNIHNIRTMIPIYGSPIAGDVAYGNLVTSTTILAKKSKTAWTNVYPQGSTNYPRFAPNIAHGAVPLRFRVNAGCELEFDGRISLAALAGTSGTLGFIEILQLNTALIGESATATHGYYNTNRSTYGVINSTPTTVSLAIHGSGNIATGDYVFMGGVKMRLY